MKDDNKKYLMLGVVFLAVGITFMMMGTVSSVAVFGDLVLATVFFVMAARKNKPSDDDKTEQ